MLFSSGRAWLAQQQRLPVVQIRDGQLRQITNDHTIGMLVWAADSLALMLARHVDGRPDRRADIALRTCEPTATTCGALAGSAWSSKTDRSGMYSFPRFIRRGVGQLAALAADRASVSRLTPYRWARALHAGPSRLLAPTSC
jgi:hypothetical protein